MSSRPFVLLEPGDAAKREGGSFLSRTRSCQRQRTTKQKVFVSVFQRTYRHTRRSHMRSPFKCSLVRSASQHKSHFSQATSTNHRVRFFLLAHRRVSLRHGHRWPNLSPFYSGRRKLPTRWGEVYGDGAALFYPYSRRTRTLTLLHPPVHL